MLRNRHVFRDFVFQRLNLVWKELCSYTTNLFSQIHFEGKVADQVLSQSFYS